MSPLISALIGLLIPCLAIAAPVRISEEGRALLAIVVPPEADPQIEELANELATGLERVTGAKFLVERSQNAKGILLGTDKEWPGELPPLTDAQSAKLCREDYRLRSENGRLLLVGRTPLAVQNGIWDLFYRIGFRQYFPGPKWEIWPSIATLAVDVDVKEAPDYFTRFTNLGVVTWTENRPGVEEWKRRNRMVSGFSLATGHIYARIIQKQKAFFEAHPEALSDTSPHAKIDASVPGVVEAIDEFVLGEMARDPGRDSISMEPSDKGGWRTDSPLGSPTDQAVTIANRAAQTLRKHYPGTKVGMHGYNYHATPPKIAVDSDVIVTVATSFIKGGNKVDDLLAGWKTKGIQTGIREYLSFGAAGHGLPGRTRATDLDYITTTLPRFHQLGARFWKTEAADAWGIYGIGYFLASRILWDIREAERKDEILADFYHRAFGAAASEMQAFFEKCIYLSGRPMLSEDLIARMYRHLERALQASDSPAISARIEDLILYTRYVELMFTYRNAPAGEKKPTYFDLLRLVQGNFNCYMFDRWTVFREIPTRDFKVPRKELRAWLNEGTMGAQLLDSEAIRQVLRAGIEANKPLPFEVAAFSDHLVPYPRAAGNEKGGGSMLLRGDNRAYLFSAESTAEFEFIVEGSQVYNDRGAIELQLFSPEHEIPEEAVARVTVPADRARHRVQLKSPYRGLHYLEISDGGGGTRLLWPEGQPISFPASAERSLNAHVFMHDMTFYVPAGTRIVAGYTETRSGKLVDPSGNVQLDFGSLEKPGYFSVPVQEGSDDALWTIIKTKRKKLLLTVPPYFSTSPSELLIPREQLPKQSTP